VRTLCDSGFGQRNGPCPAAVGGFPDLDADAHQNPLPVAISQSASEMVAEMVEILSKSIACEPFALMKGSRTSA
jgi:hypothetical protein